MTFRVLTDSAANLPPEELEKNGISVLPYYYTIDGEEKEGCDPVNFDGKAFYDHMRRGAQIDTTQISPGRYRDFMEPFLRSGEDLIFVSMSSGISGSCRTAEMTAQELREEYPERRIYVVDTIGASLGEGLLAIYAAELGREGKSVDEVYGILDAMRHRMYNVFTVDDLKYLRRTGRLSNAAAVIGTLLHIKPLLKGDTTGHIVSFEKYRGRKAAVQALGAKYAAHVKDAAHQTVGIAHADCEADAQELIRLINEADPPQRILTVGYEPVTGSHVGPGTLALFFLSEDGVREK